MLKISNIITDSANSVSDKLVKIFDDMSFSIEIQNRNSNQMDSNIDLRIIETLSKEYSVTTTKVDLLVQTDEIKIGQLDLMFIDDNFSYYMEIEKSNKKTLWFDYIKILTKLESNIDSKGIIVCPTNYAHTVGVWDLYKEAVIYKKHLQRVFNNKLLDKISVIGYTQYALLNNDWKKFDSEVVRRIKQA